MDHQERNEELSFKNNQLVLLSIGILVIFLILVVGMYRWVSGKKGGIVFPSGLNYTGPEKAAPLAKPTYDWTKLAGSANWPTFKSVNKQYSFAYPQGLIPLVFPGDTIDSVTFDVADIPVQLNLMVTAESISYYDPKLVRKHEEFVRNYWRFFSGLASLVSMENFQNEKGLTGYKAVYKTKAGVDTKPSYFFSVPADSNKIIHVTNIFPPEAESLFLRMLNSLEYIK